MKYPIARVAIATGLMLGSLGAAGIASADPATAPGTPGTPNCEGQTVAYLNQVGQDANVPGLGNVARFTNMSVKDVHALVAQYCAQ